MFNPSPYCGKLLFFLLLLLCLHYPCSRDVRMYIDQTDKLRIIQSYVFCAVFCGPLFSHLFVLCSLYCMYFFYLWVLVIYLFSHLFVLCSLYCMYFFYLWVLVIYLFSHLFVLCSLYCMYFFYLWVLVIYLFSHLFVLCSLYCMYFFY